MKKKDLANRQYGMTLVEIMIALVLGVFLITGVVQIFLGSKQTYRMQHNLARLQENGRFAMDFISRDIRMADSWGCLKKGSFDVSNKNKPLYAPYATSINGTEGASNAPDGITLVGVAGGKSTAVISQTSVAGNITVAAGNSLKVGDVVLIADCKKGDIFTINSVTGGAVIAQNITGGQDITKIYGIDASVYPLKVSLYSIQNANGNSMLPRAALFRSLDGVDCTPRPSPCELVEGIEDMQIVYGVDTNGNNSADYYVAADQVAVADRDKVVSIRVSLLVASIDDKIATVPKSYIFNGVTTLSTDRRLRRVFSSTITVRNRLP